MTILRPVRPMLVLVGVVLLLQPARAGDGGLFGAESFTLPNGMAAVAIPDRRAPIVTHMVWYRAGSADEEPGGTGVAHLLEHLMFKGTAKTPGGQFSYIVARNGGVENAFTGYDYTGYFQTVARDRLELVMELEADRMTGLLVTDEDVETERRVVLEERRMRVDNDPGALFSEEFRAARFLVHPYGWPVIGRQRDIENLTREDILAFYRERYAPNNAILVVAGDVTVDELRPLAERIYETIPPVELAPRERAREPRQQAPRRLVRVDPRAARPSLRMTYLAPTHATGPAETAYGLEILAEVLSGSTTSRLYRGLVVDRGVAVSAGAWYGGDGLDASRFGFWVAPADGVAVEEAEAALRAEIAELLERGVTEDEVARVKRRMADDLVYARDNVASIARWYGAWLAVGLTVEEIEGWAAAVDGVTVAQVNAAARQVLAPETEVVGVLLPEEPADAP